VLGCAPRRGCPQAKRRANGLVVVSCLRCWDAYCREGMETGQRWTRGHLVVAG